MRLDFHIKSLLIFFCHQSAKASYIQSLLTASGSRLFGSVVEHWTFNPVACVQILPKSWDFRFCRVARWCLVILPVLGHPTNLDNSRAWSYCAMGVGGDCLDFFFSCLLFLSFSLWETALSGRRSYTDSNTVSKGCLTQNNQPTKSWDFFLPPNLLCFVLCYAFHVLSHLTKTTLFLHPLHLKI